MNYSSSTLCHPECRHASRQVCSCEADPGAPVLQVPGRMTKLNQAELTGGAETQTEPASKREGTMPIYCLLSRNQVSPKTKL